MKHNFPLIILVAYIAACTAGVLARAERDRPLRDKPEKYGYMPGIVIGFTLISVGLTGYIAGRIDGEQRKP